MYALDILNALNEIHKNNIIHCDIKPQNFLLFESEQRLENDDEEEKSFDSNQGDVSEADSYDPNVILKVTDFGLAHFINRENSKAYMKLRAGTIEYKAPEVKDV